MQEKITLELKVEEVNTLLMALAKQPYELVTELINTIHSQASEQVNKEQPKED